MGKLPKNPTLSDLLSGLTFWETPIFLIAIPILLIISILGCISGIFKK